VNADLRTGSISTELAVRAMSGLPPLATELRTSQRSGSCQKRKSPLLEPNSLGRAASEKTEQMNDCLGGVRTLGRV
jgi:hypothetical protein